MVLAQLVYGWFYKVWAPDQSPSWLTCIDIWFMYIYIYIYINIWMNQVFINRTNFIFFCWKPVPWHRYCSLHWMCKLSLSQSKRVFDAAIIRSFTCNQARKIVYFKNNTQIYSEYSVNISDLIYTSIQSKLKIIFCVFITFFPSNANFQKRS